MNRLTQLYYTYQQVSHLPIFLKKKTSVFLCGKKKFKVWVFKEMRPVEIVFFRSDRPRDAKTLLVTILFAKAPKFFQGSSPIAAQYAAYFS
jgi:hypothetical protein